MKSRLAYEGLNWQGLGNARIHVGLVLMVVYAVCIWLTVSAGLSSGRA